MKKVCFYARVKDKSLFNLVGFYAQDIKIFESLGYEVILVNSLKELLFCKADLYYAWWFGYGIFPLIVSKLKGKAFIVSGAVHTQDCGHLKEWPFIKRVLMTFTMKNASKTLFISNVDFNRLSDLKLNNNELVYCSIDIDETLEIPKFENRENIVLTITHLTKENIKRKMLLESIEAFSLIAKDIKDYKYYICGTVGSGLEDVKEKINQLNMNEQIIIKGKISDEEKKVLLLKSKIYLQPSTCEGFGLAIIEAASLGVPVVTNSEPCIKEINENSVEYGDTSAELGHAILRLIKDEKYWNDMQYKGLYKAKKYGFINRLNKFKSILETMEK